MRSQKVDTNKDPMDPLEQGGHLGYPPVLTTILVFFNEILSDNGDCINLPHLVSRYTPKKGASGESRTLRDSYCTEKHFWYVYTEIHWDLTSLLVWMKRFGFSVSWLASLSLSLPTTHLHTALCLSRYISHQVRLESFATDMSVVRRVAWQYTSRPSMTLRYSWPPCMNVWTHMKIM